MSYLHRRGQRSWIKWLIFHFHHSDDIGTVLDAICHVGQLQSLEIHVSMHWDSDEMEAFFDKLVIGCPDLSILRIHCNNSPSIKSIHILKRFAQLQQLTLSIDSISNHYNFWREFETFPKLKRLKVYNAENFTDTWMQHLKIRIPDMEIIHHHGSIRF